VKREQKREQTKRLLLETTKALIMEKGCDQTTFKDIMERSGLSKGAIFHYVSGKDELLALVLEAHLEETNRKFFDAVARGGGAFGPPMRALADSFATLDRPDDATNRVLSYLLGRSEQPLVREALRRFHERAAEASKSWILAGQRGGVIPATVDAERTAELFVLLGYGIRMRAFVSVGPHPFGIAEFTDLIANTLQPGGASGRGDE